MTPKKTHTKKSSKNVWRTIGFIIGALVWVAASVIVAQLIVGYIMLFILGRDAFLKPVPTTIYSALSYIFATILIIIIPPLIINKYKKAKLKIIDREELGLQGLPTWTDIGLAPVGFIVYILLAAGLTALFSLFPWFNPEEAQEVGFNTFIIGFDRVVAFLTLVIVAPFFEEIIFRGWLYGRLRIKLNKIISNLASTIISILLVSILFGIVHLQWNVGVNVFAMSIVLCGLREITGSIYAGILLHMLKNGVAFFLLYVLGI